MRSLIRRELTPLGVVTEEAENGQVALDVAARFAPDFITLDLDMPVLDGFQTCEDLKSREATMHIPVLVVSAHPSDTSRLRALAAGAVDYYVKPFPEGGLRGFVRDFFAHASARRGVRVCVVEAVASARRATAHLLEAAGYTVAAHESIESARAAMRDGGCDLMVLDLDLPEYSGLALLQSLRRQPALEHTPIVGLTGSAARRDLPVAFHVGVTDLLRKPFFPEELLARVENQLRVMNLEKRLRVEATTDGLTGLYNRRELERLAQVEVARARRDRKALGVLIIDVDHFKSVNDTYGHAIGDVVLRAVSREIVKRVRTTDIVARYGGEEFAVLLPQAAVAGVGYVAERARLAIETLEHDADGVRFSRSVSLGGTSWSPDELATRSTLEALFRVADEALYHAKQSGRNRVRIVDSAGHPVEAGRRQGG